MDGVVEQVANMCENSAERLQDIDLDASWSRLHTNMSGMN